jgi:Flp pilus assembly protein TadD
MSESAAKCPQCGKATEEEGVEDAAEGTENGALPASKDPEALFMCPSCGAFMAADAKACTQCGALIEGEEEDAPVQEGKVAVPAPATQEEEQVITLCVACGAMAAEGSERCPNCNAVLRKAGESKKPALGAEDMQLLDMLVKTPPEVAGRPSSPRPAQTRRSPGPVAICAVCGAFVKPDASKCGVCGTMLDETMVKAPDFAEVLPDAGTLLTRAVGSFRAALKIVKKIEDMPPPSFEETNIDVCTVCGAFMQRGGPKCPICNTVRAEMPPLETLAAPVAESPVTKSLFVCPKCGSFSREGDEVCGKCGAQVPVTVSSVVPDARDTLDKVEGVLMRALGVSDVKLWPPDEPKASELDICVNCGAFMVVGASKCPMCGAGAGGDVDDLFKMLKTEEPEGSAEAQDFSECPFCAARLAPGATSCEACGFVFAPEIERTMPERELDDLEKDLRVVNLVGDGYLDEDLPRREATVKKKDDIVSSKPSVGEEAQTDEILDMLVIEEGGAPGASSRPSEKKATAAAKDDIMGMLAPADESSKKIEDELDELELGDSETVRPSNRRPDDELPQSVLDLERELDLAVSTGVEKKPAIEVKARAAPPKAQSAENGSRAKPRQKKAELGRDELIARLRKAYSEGRMSREMFERNMAKLSPTVDTREREAPVAAHEKEPGLVQIRSEPAIVDASEVPAQVGEQEGSVEEPVDEKSVVFQEPEPASAPEPEPYIEARASDLEPQGADMPSRRASEEIPPWSDNELIDYLILACGAVLFLYIVMALLSPEQYHHIVLAGFQVVTFSAYSLSRIVYGGVGLTKRSVRWLSFALAGMTLMVLAAVAPRGSTPIDYALVGASLGFTALAAFVSPKGWRKRLMWSSGMVAVVSFAWLNSTEPEGRGAMLLLAASLALLVAACAEAFVDMRQRATLEMMIARGDARYMRSDYRRAAEEYDEAIERIVHGRETAKGTTGYDVPWYRKGAALVLAGDLEEGIRCLDMALRINPRNAVTWVNKGNALSKLGRHQEAMSAFERALRINPRYEIAWNNKGNALARQGEYMGALKCYNQAIKVNPKYYDVWINKGYVLAKMGKYEEAARCVSVAKTPIPSKA